MYAQRPGPRRYGPPPRYGRRRALAASVAVLVVFGGTRACGAIRGEDGEQVTASSTVPSTTTTTVVPAPPCTVEDYPTIFGRPEDWFRTIVDTKFALDPGYEPPDLVSAAEANYDGDFRIRQIVAEDLNAMRNAILEAGVPEVALLAAYRSFEDQRSLYERRVEQLGEDDASDGTARPGHSEHHLGTTIDVRLVGEDNVDQSFGDTPTGKWIEAHSWEHGFVLSYPRGQEAVSCYKYEPWHLRYVGVELAGRMHASGLVPRQYLLHWEVTGTEPKGPPPATTPATTTGSTATSAAGGEG